MKYNYQPQGVCPRMINFELDGDKVTNVSFVGGCNGNLKAVSKLVDGMTVEQTTACAKAFCDEVKACGMTPMLYAGDDEFTAKYDLTQLSDVEIWHCEYADTPNAPYPIGMWQYSKTAVVDGIEGSADLDLRIKGH